MEHYENNRLGIESSRFLGKGIILYGNSKESNEELAYEIITDILSIDKSYTPDELLRYIKNDVFPDFLRVSKREDSSDISIEQTRFMREFLSHKTMRNSSRAVWIQNAELLSKSASNSILKVLEEIPEDSSIILTTSSIGAVIPTIRSRCQKFYVKPKNKQKINELTLPQDTDILSFAKDLSSDQEKLEFFFLSIREFVFNEAMKDIKNKKLAENYLSIDNFINTSRKTHIDNQSIVVGTLLILGKV